MKKFWIIFWGLLIVSSTTAQTQKPSLSCLPEGITFTTQAQIDSFQINYPECTEILGDVTICGNDITNLNGLSGLISIGGFLLIGDWNSGGNPSLISLTGLENLTSIRGDLGICRNDALTSLTGLDNLTSIWSDLWIWGNYALTSLTRLDNVTGIGGYLHIGYNNALTSLTGLDNLTSILAISIYYNTALTSLTGLDNLTSIWFFFNITENDALTTLATLENLTSIGSYLDIYNNNALTSLAGLDNLTSIGEDLLISNNDALTSLTGLDNVTAIGGDLWIDDNDVLTSLTGLNNINGSSISNLYIFFNPLLSNCAVKSICDYLISPNGTVEIHDNAQDCNSQEEVKEDCANGTETNPVQEMSLSVFPNPTPDQVTIAITLKHPAEVRIEILNNLGQVISVVDKSLSQGEQQITWNAEGMPPGLYFYRLTVDKLQTANGKLMVLR